MPIGPRRIDSDARLSSLIRLLVRFVIASALCSAFCFHSARAQGGATLSGVVYYGSRPIPNFPVSLYSADRVLRTETDKSGRFEFANLAPGTYDVQAFALGVEGHVFGVRVRRSDVGPVVVKGKELGFGLGPSGDCGRTFWATYSDDSTGGN